MAQQATIETLQNSLKSPAGKPEIKPQEVVQSLDGAGGTARDKAQNDDQATGGKQESERVSGDHGGEQAEILDFSYKILVQFIEQGVRKSFAKSPIPEENKRFSEQEFDGWVMALQNCAPQILQRVLSSPYSGVILMALQTFGTRIMLHQEYTKKQQTTHPDQNGTSEKK